MQCYVSSQIIAIEFLLIHLIHSLKTIAYKKACKTWFVSIETIDYDNISWNCGFTSVTAAWVHCFVADGSDVTQHWTTGLTIHLRDN